MWFFIQKKGGIKMRKKPLDWTDLNTKEEFKARISKEMEKILAKINPTLKKELYGDRFPVFHDLIEKDIKEFGYTYWQRIRVTW